MNCSVHSFKHSEHIRATCALFSSAAALGAQAILKRLVCKIQTMPFNTNKVKYLADAHVQLTQYVHPFIVLKSAAVFNPISNQVTPLVKS